MKGDSPRGDESDGIEPTSLPAKAAFFKLTIMRAIYTFRRCRRSPDYEAARTGMGPLREFVGEKLTSLEVLVTSSNPSS